MTGLGQFLLFFGAGSVVLNLLEREFVILMWIDRWGPQVGWAIRIGMIVVGAGLWIAGVVGKKKGDAGPAPTA